MTEVLPDWLKNPYAIRRRCERLKNQILRRRDKRHEQVYKNGKVNEQFRADSSTRRAERKIIRQVNKVLNMDTPQIDKRTRLYQRLKKIRLDRRKEPYSEKFHKIEVEGYGHVPIKKRAHRFIMALGSIEAANMVLPIAEETRNLTDTTNRQNDLQDQYKRQ